MLRLVHPSPEGNGGDPPTRRKGRRSPFLSLSRDEARHLRAAIRNIARAYGSLSCLAAVIGVKPGILTAKRRPSPGLAVAVARAGGVTVDAVLSGTLNDAGRCKACGARVASGKLAAGGAS